MSRRDRNGIMMRLVLALILMVTMISSAQAAWKPTPIHQAITAQQGWLNTERALTANDLAGRIILLDFWTFCCINCIHVIPDLHYLEEKFGDKLTVIGVHSAKFRNERDTENIRQAILRYHIEHPVVNDFDFTIWQRFGVRAWPTFILINPDGRMENVYSGEGNRADVEADIAKLLRTYDAFNHAPLPMALEKDRMPASVLSFPGKLAYADAIDGAPALLVSDSNHHRILVMSLDGEVRDQIGSGLEGREDGSFDTAQFDTPQGIVFNQGVIYIADTNNHLIRAADLSTRKVMTIAGTGEQGYDRFAQDADGLKTALSSPWDLAFFPDWNHLTIAMAGLHQLWALDLKDRSIGVLAGNGRESIDDGEYPLNSLSQPSGLSVHDQKLYLVDSETSSLRVLDAEGELTTLIGTGLFDFGYEEGRRGTALMQHPLGVFAGSDGIYVADSYNHAIRRFDPATGILRNFAGTGKRGDKDGAQEKALFNEPNAIVKIGDALYIADTNNHRIRIIDASGQVRTLNVKESAMSGDNAVSFTHDLPNLQPYPPMALLPGREAALRLMLEKGWKINDEAPSYLALFKMQKGTPVLIQSWNAAQVRSGELILPALEKETSYRLQGMLYYCEKKEGAECLLQGVDIDVMPDEDGTTLVTLPVKPAAQ